VIDLLKSLTKTKASALNLHDLLDQSQEAVAEAKARHEAVLVAPQDLEAALASFDAWLDQAATDAVDRLSLRHALSPNWRGPQLPVVTQRVADSVVRDAVPATELLIGLIALTGRDALRDVVRGQLEDHLEGGSGMTAATRSKKSAEAKADILSAELMEERIVRTMKASGINVCRRPDADPRALLASDASLPN
jgi:hypothetical protein